MNDFERTLAILSKTKRNGNCLEGKTSPAQRYPYITIGRKRRKASRIVLTMWEQNNGGGLYALHTCDNTKCINPAHLYWGTQSQNNLDSSERKRHINAKKTHCKSGHPFSTENTWIVPSGVNKGKRVCKACSKKWRIGRTPRSTKTGRD